MSNNINSFAQNLAQLTESAAKVINVAEAMNETIEGNSAEVYISDGVALPSYANMVKRVERAENTVAQFTKGKGIVETDDGTYRKIKVSTVSCPPTDIGKIDAVDTFNINANWFFESLQYPRCVVKIDLTGKIEDTSDRVYINRIIIDADELTNNVSGKDFYLNNIAGKSLSYNVLIDLLNESHIPYKEDRDEVKLPLTYEKYNGAFTVQKQGLLKDSNGISRLWYFVDNINYSTVDENGRHIDNGNILSVNDYLRFNDSLYRIIEIDQHEKRFRLEYAVGYATIGEYDTLEFYNPPFAEKVIEVGIGIDEIDIIYAKGVNEEYNLLSRAWSNPVSFYTNDLVYDEDSNMTFETFYEQGVADFGRDLIAKIKEGQISAYVGIEPTAPTLNAEDLRVVQINTQLESTLDTDRYNNLTTQIASTKSNITATRNIIAVNKDLLTQTSDNKERENIQNTITNDTESLNSLTTEFTSLVEELNTLLTDANVIKYTPKYHIRGFFGIPDPQVNKAGKRQSIIAFEIMYRYLHTDETGAALNTFNYTSNGASETGVFSDWNMVSSNVLTKKYDPDSDTFVWVNTNPMDGTQININQIDIPINNGEKVEIKVRSISEAGYPYNPLKSDWSNSVIIAFPDNLTTDDSVTTILNNVRNDMTAVVLQETMSAAGVYTHLSDNNSTFKHNAANIEYVDVQTIKQADGTLVPSIVEMSLADKIKQLEERIR